jgi:transposase
VKTPVPQIVRMWLTDESHVRKVIHEFDEEGFDSPRPDYRRGRPRRITVAERKRVVGGGRCPLRYQRGAVDALVAGQTLRPPGRSGSRALPTHLWRLLAEAGLSFQRSRSWKASPDPTMRPEPPGCWSYTVRRRSTAGDQLRPATA